MSDLHTILSEFRNSDERHQDPAIVILGQTGTRPSWDMTTTGVNNPRSDVPGNLYRDEDFPGARNTVPFVEPTINPSSVEHDDVPETIDELASIQFRCGGANAQMKR